MRFQPGSKIGDYEVLGQLGAGGMGRVYKVRNELSDRVEAMKVLLPDFEGQAELAHRFLREIKVQAGLDHPNIAKLYTALRIDNQLLMCMELVDGVTLDQRLHEGTIALVDAIDYTMQVLSALEYAHQRGVVHRDIKPANMMLMPDSKIKLLDFGIAKATDNRLTVTGTTLGSLYYMSPEQIQGGQVDVRSDVYSVGVSLYELVTGKRPFDADNQFAIMTAHLARMPVSPSELNPSLPASVSNVILMALNKEPATRFQTAGEFLDALRDVQEEVGYGTTTAPAPAPRTTRKTMVPGTTRSSIPKAAPLGDSLRLTAMQRSAMQPPDATPQPVGASGPAEEKSGPKRLIWVAVGSLCAVGVIVGFIQFGPNKNTSAKEGQPTSFTVTPSSAAGGAKPSLAQRPTSKPSAVPTAPAGESRKQPPTQRAESQQNSPPSFPSEPPAQQPRQPAAPAAAASPQATGGGPQPGLINNDRVEVQRLSDRLELLYVRAKGVRDTLQAQQGGPKPELVESFNKLNQYLKQATAAINDGNPLPASQAMSSAAKELEGLEKALGK